MAAVQRFRLKQTPTDVWSTRERLCLASSVMRSGDQNWVSVSRAIKPFGEANRPADWFSQKNCALQYSDLLEKVETPKRKRGERTEVETPGECIVRKLTLERIDELKRIVIEERQQYKKFKDELEMVSSARVDDRLQSIWAEILEEKKRKVEANAAHEKWLQDREVAKLAAAAALRVGKVPPKKQQQVQVQQPEFTVVTTNTSSVGRQNSLQSENSSEVEIVVENPAEEICVIGSTEVVALSSQAEPVSLTVSTVSSPSVASAATAPHHSPLLNNLLRSNSSHPCSTPTTPTHVPSSNATIVTPTKETSPRSQLSLSSPTITSLLSSSPSISTSLTSSVVNLFTTALGGTQPTDSETVHSVAKPPVTSPSQGAPTLLKLLDMPLGAPGKLPPLPILTTELDALPAVDVVATTTSAAITADVDSLVTVKMEKMEETVHTVEAMVSVCETQSLQELSTVEVATSTAASPSRLSPFPPVDGEYIPVIVKEVNREMAEHVEDLLVVVKEVNETDVDVVVEDAVESVETQVETVAVVDSDDRTSADLSVEHQIKESDKVVTKAKPEVDKEEDVLTPSVEVKAETEETNEEPAKENVDTANTVREEDFSPPLATCVTEDKVEQVEDNEERKTPSLEVLEVADDMESSQDGVCKTRSNDEERRMDKEEDAAAFLSVTSKTTNEDEDEDDGEEGEEVDEDEDEEDDWDSSRMSSGTNESVVKGNKQTTKEVGTKRRFTRGRGQGSREVRTRSEARDDNQANYSRGRNREETGRSSLRLASAKKMDEESGGRSTRLTRSRREESPMISTPISTMTRKRRDPMKGKGKEQIHASLFTKREDDDDDEDGESDKAPLSSGKTRDDGTDGSGREDELFGGRSSHTMDSIPNSPSSTSFCGDDPESVRDYKLWKKSIMLVWRSAANHKFANVFLHAVTEEMAPGYRSVVYRPMDMITIKKNIENGAIKTTSEFQRDVMLMFQNAIMYNNSDHDVCKMAIEMEKEVMPHIQHYLATQLMVQSTSAPKSLRRETREQSQKRGGDGTREKEDVESSKRKRVSSEGSFELRDSKRRRTRADD